MSLANNNLSTYYASLMPPNNKKILIIEDDKPIAKALSLKLTHAGFKTYNLFNGETVIKTLEEETFDLIICDLIMPKIDGFHVLTELQSKKIKIPVIVLTNLSQDSDQKRTQLLGAKEFLIKSNISITEVVERIKNILK